MPADAGFWDVDALSRTANDRQRRATHGNPDNTRGRARTFRPHGAAMDHRHGDRTKPTEPRQHRSFVSYLLGVWPGQSLHSIMLQHNVTGISELVTVRVEQVR